jgi:NitT/TauT family transport system permease protein
MAVTEARTAQQVESGLDQLDLPASGSTPWQRRAVQIVVPKLVALGLLLGVWQLVSVGGWWANSVPSPASVWDSFVQQWQLGNITQAVGTTLLHVAEGYAVAIAIGTPIGLLIARVRVVRYAIGSLIAALQSLPSVCWAPIAVLWFGVQPTMLIFVVVMGAFPSIAGGTVSAVDQIPPLLLRVGDAMGARGLSRYRHIILPAALPGYVSGLKQAWSFSWRSLMAAELIITAPAALGLGLGQLLDSGRSLSDFPLMFMTIFVILFVGVIVDSAIFAPLDRSVRRRRGLSAA